MDFVSCTDQMIVPKESDKVSDAPMLQLYSRLVTQRHCQCLLALSRVYATGVELVVGGCAPQQVN